MRGPTEGTASPGGSGKDKVREVRKHRKSRASGFGLVELMLALTAATVVLVAVGAAQTTCMNLARTSEETNTAVSDLEAAMESLLSEPLESLPTAFPEGQSLAVFDDLHLENQRVVPNYPGYDGLEVPDPFEIELTVTWDDFAGRSRSLSTASVKTR